MNEATEGLATGLVMPLDGRAGTTADAWELMARGEGLLISTLDSSLARGRATHASLSASSALARRLTEIASQMPQQAAKSAVASGETLFRIEQPGGSTLRDLVQASGGGYRGLVRAGDSSKFTGQVRLVPSGGRQGAAIGKSLAAGPALALIAVAVASEALARYQLEKKLDAIRDTLRDLQRGEMERQVAVLDSAEEALQHGAAALLDQIAIPDSIGLGPSRNNLRELVKQGVGWLEQWERSVQDLQKVAGATGVSVDEMCDALGIRDDNPYAFAHRVSVFYRALVLDARAQVLTETQASLAHPESALAHLRASLQSSLAVNASLQARLREVLWSLAGEPVTFSLPAFPSTGRKAAALDRMLARLASGMARMPDAPPLLTQSDHQVVEVVRNQDGSVRILEPVG